MRVKIALKIVVIEMLVNLLNIVICKSKLKNLCISQKKKIKKYILRLVY